MSLASAPTHYLPPTAVAARAQAESAWLEFFRRVRGWKYSRRSPQLTPGAPNLKNSVVPRTESPHPSNRYDDRRK